MRYTTWVRSFLGTLALVVACGCANLSTLQSARALPPGSVEHSVQGWLVPSNGALTRATESSWLLLPAYSRREGLPGQSEWGTRVTAPGDVQVDFKAAGQRGRWAASFGMGFGTDLVSLILAAAKDDEKQQTQDSSSKDSKSGLLTFEAFVPFIASFDVVPEYVSLHAVVRPQVWLFTPADTLGRYVEFSVLAGGGLRVGRDYGVHLEAAPVWSTGRGLGYTGGAALFFRFPP